MEHASTSRMTVDEFLRWSARQPEGRYELFDGVPVRQSHDGVSMQAETLRHVRVKGSVNRTLWSAVQASGAPCEVLTDGATVKIDATTSFVPDVVVACGSLTDANSLTVDNPVVVVEVLSQGTAKRDFRDKLEGYGHVQSIRHYLILDPDKPLVIHHARQREGGFLTRLLSDGDLRLDPPGLAIPIAAFFP